MADLIPSEELARRIVMVHGHRVMLDVDLYRPALEVLRFFYPRMVRGGYFFMHDFNSPESESK